MSAGRVDFGIGEGATATELHPFDRNFEEKREIWEDAVRCIIPMFTEESWEYHHGKWFDFPARNVLPILAGELEEIDTNPYALRPDEVPASTGA